MATTSGGRGSMPRHWTPQEDEQLRSAIAVFGENDWRQVATGVPGRTHLQCMQRWKKALRPGLVKGPWSEEEDEMLKSAIAATPDFESWWGTVAKNVPGRTAKQCRERWRLNLDPALRHGPWDAEEDAQLLALQQKHGRRWAKIAREMKGRTEHSVKTRALALERERERNRPWTSEEDELLLSSVARHAGDWKSVVSDLSNRTKAQAKTRFSQLRTMTAAGRAQYSHGGHALAVPASHRPHSLAPPPLQPPQYSSSARMPGRTHSVEVLLSILGDEAPSTTPTFIPRTVVSAPAGSAVPAANFRARGTMRRFGTSAAAPTPTPAAAPTSMPAPAAAPVGMAEDDLLWGMDSDASKMLSRAQSSMQNLRLSDEPPPQPGGYAASRMAPPPRRQPTTERVASDMLGWMDDETAQFARGFHGFGGSELDEDDLRVLGNPRRSRSRAQGMRRLNSMDFDLV